MAKLILKFDAYGQCDLCGGRTNIDPLKDRKIMLIVDGCYILFNICLACLLQNQLKAIKKDGCEEVEIEKEHFDIVVKN